MSLGLTILRKDSLMRKNIGCLVVAAAAVFASGAKADLYQECLDKHYMSDNEMAGCNEAEADRIMGEIRKRMNSIAAKLYPADFFYQLLTDLLCRQVLPEPMQKNQLV